MLSLSLSRTPFREVMRSLGEASLIEKEMTSILLDQQIDDVEFSEDVEACLPKIAPWKIPEVQSEENGREKKNMKYSLNYCRVKVFNRSHVV